MKSPNLGGPERDRTVDLSDAKSYAGTIFADLCCFLVVSVTFPLLSGALCHPDFRVLQGSLWSGVWSKPLLTVFLPVRGGFALLVW